MTRDETIALFLECEAKRAEALNAAKSEEEAHEAARTHWNAWAERMLAERRELISLGDGTLHRRRMLDDRHKWLQKHSPKMRVWLNKARVDFSQSHFVSRSNIEECISDTTDATSKLDKLKNFISERRTRALIEGDARWSLSGAPELDRYIPVIVSESVRTDFSGFLFPSEARFDYSRFFQQAWFFKAHFIGDTRFNGVFFTGHAGFNEAQFSGDSWFNSTFANSAWFKECQFDGDALFVHATFGGYTTFQETRFRRAVSFHAIRSASAFELSDVTFECTPDLIQAHFEEAPRLDNVAISTNLDAEFSQPTINTSSYLDIPARWRALKRLAIQAHDTDGELEFNAQEIRAERAASRWPIPNKAHGWKIWLRLFFGWLYGVFSNYGRSLVRPLAAWAIGILAFAAFYFSQTEVLQRDLSLKDSWSISATVRAGGYALFRLLRSAKARQRHRSSRSRDRGRGSVAGNAAHRQRGETVGLLRPALGLSLPDRRYREASHPSSRAR
jgi:hypothetical protein